MTERPILFSGPMVQAILAGTKTQTRRVVKPQPTVAENGCPQWGTYDGRKMYMVPRRAAGGSRVAVADLLDGHCPYGAPGDRLWVRETWATVKWFDDTNAAACWKNERPPALWFAADTGVYLTSEHRGRWRPSIHMPRWASRITLEVTGVRVERLQDISEADARAEGVLPLEIYTPRERRGQSDYRGAFALLWDHINGKRPGCAWNDSPWVWVIEFRKVEL